MQWLLILIENEHPKPLGTLKYWNSCNCLLNKELENGYDTGILPQETFIFLRRARTRHGTIDWFQIGKGVRRGCILSPWLFNLYAEDIMWNARLEHKLESRLLGEISITSDMQMTPSLSRKRRTKEPFDESERGEWKSWLKTQHSEN